jgi:pimeloyl-ACP methyl ester carboxylesterase
MRSTRLRAFLAVCVVALAACSGGSSGSSASKSTSTTAAAAGASTPAQKLHWKSCDNGQCATLSVPLDESRPFGPQVKLALAMEPAKKPDERIGSLLINPGGPGAPGTDFVKPVATELPEAITDRFDIVGWDPRGTGASDPVDCGKKLDYLFDVDTAPADAAESAALSAASQRFANACEAGSPNLLPHIASIDTVHDMDRIRAALGDDKLTYAGFSYGTYLGALYAEHYPDHVRALLLDGAIDPSVSVDDVQIQQAQGFEASLGTFLRSCARDTSCAYHHGGDPKAALDALRARIARTPMKGGAGRTLGPSQLDIALAAPLYSGSGGYKVLATALSKADHGDPSALLELFDEYVTRNPDGTYSTEWPAFLAISCADGPNLSPAAAAALQVRAAQAAPYFGASNVGLSLPCSYWPVPPVNAAPTPVSAPSAPPVVVVGTTGDPATPIEWAQGLAGELGDARLVTVDGSTHTSSLEANPCLDAANVAYLVHLRPPKVGLRCGS